MEDEPPVESRLARLRKSITRKMIVNGTGIAGLLLLGGGLWAGVSLPWACVVVGGLLVAGAIVGARR